MEVYDANNQYFRLGAAIEIRVDVKTRKTKLNLSDLLGVAINAEKKKLKGKASLRCHPPKANPMSHVIYWIKDGKKLDTDSDPNFIHSSAGKCL